MARVMECTYCGFRYKVFPWEYEDEDKCPKCGDKYPKEVKIEDRDPFGYEKTRKSES